MKLTSLLQRVDKLQQAGKIDNLEQVCSDFCYHVDVNKPVFINIAASCSFFAGQFGVETVNRTLLTKLLLRLDIVVAAMSCKI